MRHVTFILALLVALSGCVSENDKPSDDTRSSSDSKDTTPPAEDGGSSTTTNASSSTTNPPPKTNATTNTTGNTSTSTTPPAQPTPKHLTREFDVTLNPSPGDGTGTNINNCLSIEGDTQIVEGEATATWTPQAPTAQELTFVFGTEARVSGPSPLRLDLPAVDLADDATTLGVQGKDDGTAITVQQTVHITLALDYTGEEPTFTSAGCYVAS